MALCGDPELAYVTWVQPQQPLRPKSIESIIDECYAALLELKKNEISLSGKSCPEAPM